MTTEDFMKRIADYFKCKTHKLNGWGIDMLCSRSGWCTAIGAIGITRRLPEKKLLAGQKLSTHWASRDGQTVPFIYFVQLGRETYRARIGAEVVATDGFAEIPESCFKQF